MAVAASNALVRPRRNRFARWLRRRNDVWLGVAMGGLVALLILRLPMDAALASSVVGAFIIVSLVDTRVALLTLILIRAIIDVAAKVPLLGAEGAVDINAAAVMTFLIIGIGVAHIGTRRLKIWRMPLIKPFSAYLAIAFIGLALAPDLGLALEDWLRAVSAFLVYVLVVDLMEDQRDWRLLIHIMIMAAVVPVAVGVYQFATDTGQQSEGIRRLVGTFTHPAPYAFFLVGLLPLSIVTFVHTRSRLLRVGLLVLIPAMMLDIYGSQTRGAWIGLAVLATVFLATRARWAVLLVPLAAGALFFALPGVQARFDEASSDTGSVFWRQKTWEESLRVASPVQMVTTGAGLRAVDVELGALSHNEYIRLFAETGVWGLLSVLLLYKGLLGIALKGYREAESRYKRDLMLAFIMALVARMVSALADNILIFPVLEWYFWAFAGVIVVAAGAYQRRPAYLAEPDAAAEVKSAA